MTTLEFYSIRTVPLQQPEYHEPCQYTALATAIVASAVGDVRRYLDREQSLAEIVPHLQYAKKVTIIGDAIMAYLFLLGQRPSRLTFDDCCHGLHANAAHVRDQIMAALMAHDSKGMRELHRAAMAFAAL